MADNETQYQNSSLSLTRAIGIYLAFLLMIIAMIAISLATSTLFLLGTASYAYLIFGFLLNRLVLRQLIEWRPIYNTIGNISSAKLSLFLLWPVAYANLFIRLSINKIL